MMFFRTGRISAVALGIVAFSVVVFGLAHGAGAASMDDARITERMTADEIGETETPQEKAVPDEWQNSLDELTGEPNPWMQKRVESMTLTLANSMFWLADQAAVFGYQNRGWISPAWVMGIGSLSMAVMTVAMIGVAGAIVRSIAAEGT